ncbi:MAG: DUF1150 domain-containing protein [Rickettsiales bacterium]|nr:DUF1150 domain-containing protein [Rickettsiales bacterium]
MTVPDLGTSLTAKEALIAAVQESSFLTYIREISVGDHKAYAVCAEDGLQLAVFQTPEAAYFSARQFNLIPVSVH